MIAFPHDTHKAQQAVTAAERRRLPVPEPIHEAARMWQTVMDAAHMEPPERPTRDTLPATVAELRTAIEARAHAHRIAAAHRDVAADYMEPVARRYNQLVRDQVPGWILALQPQFTTLVKALQQQAKKLPEQLDVQQLDWDNPKIAAAWEKAESASHQLDQLIADRQRMARAVGGDLGRDAELHAVAKLPTPSMDAVLGNHMRDHVGPAIRQWRDLKGQPVSRWLYLARSPHFELQLATPGEVEQRAAALQRWYDAIAAMQAAGTRNAAVAGVQRALAA